MFRLQFFFNSNRINQNYSLNLRILMKEFALICDAIQPVDALWIRKILNIYYSMLVSSVNILNDSDLRQMFEHLETRVPIVGCRLMFI